MSQCGRDFLIAAIDPMHDTQLQNLAGWPDLECAGSVRRCIKQSINISKPAAGITTNNWDCHIVCWPWLTQSLCSAIQQGNNVLQDNPAALPGAFGYGGITTFATNAGELLDIFHDIAGNHTTASGLLTLDATFTKGVGRCVGIGFEVINTTSDLNRQGTCTVYRSPQLKDSEFTAQVQMTGLNGFLSCQQVRPPPVTIDEAMLFPGSRQWKAAEGCYCVYPFVGAENPPKAQEFTNPVVCTDRTALVSETLPAVTPAISAVAGGGVQIPPIKIEDLHMPGAMFTGLSAETTLTLNWNVYYESFPSVDEREILVMATPSCHYDPIALEFFSRALSTLPIGVPAADNPSGEFFSDFVEGIAKYAPKLGKAMGGPFDLLGQGIGSVAEYVHDNYMAPPTPQTKPKLNQQRKVTKKGITQDEVNQMISRAVAAQRARQPPQKKKAANKGKGKTKSKRN